MNPDPHSYVLPALRTLALFVAPLLIASCQRQAINPADSLVGAKSLPTVSELSREKIVLQYKQEKSLTRLLSFELLPNNSWAIVIVDPNSDRELSRRTYPLPPTRAAAIRKQLWRLRPEKLDGIEELHNPADCPPQPMNSTDEIAIGFIREGPKPGIADDQLAVFTLPRVEDCRTPHSQAARNVINDVMRKMPGEQLRIEYAFTPPSE